jgi:peptide/nickel transport system permease protein
MTLFADSPEWRAFRRNPTALIGLALVALVVFAALFADFIAPYPSHAGPIGDFGAMNARPSGQYFLGTDTIGRDLLTRVIYAYRLSLEMAVVVLAIATPIGVVVGLLAGYLGRAWSYALMRLTDVFLSIPPLVLAMSITGFLEPSAIHGMMAITAMWWPWYARLAYNLTRAERQEGYVLAAETVGASLPHILFREILPNCMPAIFTKMTIDVGFVILIASSMSFLGLGAQAPTPDLGSMVADGAKYMPDAWWLTVFPALAILVVVMGFNLLGDGLREAADVRR